MKVFPLPMTAPVTYADRYGEGPTDHRGTDLFAPEGTPVYAVIDGAAQPELDPKGGIVVYLADESGNETYYYAHLQDVSDDLIGAHYSIVKAGDLIGHVGNSGNAAGGPPHLHFQAKINGRVVNPYPLLRAVDHVARGEHGPFPRTPKPTAESIPGRGPFPKGGGRVMTPEEPMGLWGLALLLGAYMVWKTFGGGGHG